jgi:hypothetical protein
MGRPRALDHVKRGEICALISVGCSLEAAARYVGCHTITIRREVLRDEEFCDQFRAAEVKCQLVPLQSVRDAARTHWRAAAWLLERADPDKFARPTPRILTVGDYEEFLALFMKKANETIRDDADRDRFFDSLMNMWKALMNDDRPNRNELAYRNSTFSNEDEDVPVRP